MYICRSIKEKGRGFKAVSEINAGDNLIIEKGLAFLIYPLCTCVNPLPTYRCFYCSTVIFKFVP